MITYELEINIKEAFLRVVSSKIYDIERQIEYFVEHFAKYQPVFTVRVSYTEVKK